jgi:hypothetical protein
MPSLLKTPSADRVDRGPARRAAAMIAWGTVISALAVAQSATSGPAPGDWQSSASIYAYLPSIGGATSFPADAGGTPINVTAEQILDRLKMTFMGSYEGHEGSWGFATDLLYVDLGNRKTNSRDFTIGDVGLPAGTSADLNWDYKATVWTVAGLYRVRSDSAWTVDLLGGARLLDQRQRLEWAITGNLGPLAPAARSGSTQVKESVWDAIVGVKGRYAFGADGHWAVPFYLDAGAGQSESTVQAAAGIGYRFSWGDLNALYRYIGYHAKAGAAIQEMNYSGPQLGAMFHW